MRDSCTCLTPSATPFPDYSHDVIWLQSGKQPCRWWWNRWWKRFRALIVRLPGEMARPRTKLYYYIVTGPRKKICTASLELVAGWPINSQRDQPYDQLVHAGWPAHTQLDQFYDQLVHAGWPAHTQLDQFYDQLAHACWPAHTQLDQFYNQLVHAGWLVHTQLHQLYDQLDHVGWLVHTQLVDQLYDQLAQVSRPVHSQLDQLYNQLGWPVPTPLWLRAALGRAQVTLLTDSFNHV